MMDPVRQAAFERRVMNRRLRAERREARRVRRAMAADAARPTVVATPLAPFAGAPPIPNGFRPPIPSASDVARSPTQALPKGAPTGMPQARSGGCGGCGKRSKGYKRRVEAAARAQPFVPPFKIQPRSAMPAQPIQQGKRPDAQPQQQPTSLAGRSSQPPLKR